LTKANLKETKSQVFFFR